MSKLSVIVPVFNQEKFLSECLNSILCNSYSDIEVICIDDGSTDNSLSILKDYERKDKRVKIYSQTNQGQSEARNVGISKSSSDYITFVDADDILRSDTFEICMKYIDKYDLIVYGISVFGQFYSQNRAAEQEYYKIKFSGEKDIDEYSILNTDVSCCNKVFSRKIIESNNILFPKGLIFEDECFFYKYISCISKCYYINDYMYFYRRDSDDSIMGSLFIGKNKAEHHLFVLNDIYSFWKKNNYLKEHSCLFLILFKKYFNHALIYSARNNKINTIVLARRICKIILKQDRDNTFRNDELIKKITGFKFIPMYLLYLLLKLI